MKDDHTTNSQYITYAFLFKMLRRVYFLNLGVEELILLLPVQSPLHMFFSGLDIRSSMGIYCFFAGYKD